jgi:hypothetical protein
MEEVFTHGRMAESTKANISSIKNMVLGHIPGKMGEDMWDNGKIAKGMEEAKLYQSMGARDKAYGKMMSKLTIVKSRQAM